MKNGYELTYKGGLSQGENIFSELPQLRKRLFQRVTATINIKVRDIIMTRNVRYMSWEESKC